MDLDCIWWDNKPSLNYLQPLFQSTSWCTSFERFIRYHPYANFGLKTHFHTNDSAPGLVSKRGQKQFGNGSLIYPWFRTLRKNRSSFILQFERILTYNKNCRERAFTYRINKIRRNKRLTFLLGVNFAIIEKRKNWPLAVFCVQSIKTQIYPWLLRNRIGLF